MTQLITEFSPEHGLFTTTFFICLLLLASTLLFVYFNQRRTVPHKDRNMRNMLSMLAMFVAVFALGFAGFELFLNRNVTTVELYDNGLHLPKGEVKFTDIRHIYIDNAGQGAVSPRQKAATGNKVLVVEQYDGTNHFLLEKDYDIQNMISPIREQFDKVRGSVRK